MVKGEKAIFVDPYQLVQDSYFIVLLLSAQWKMTQMLNKSELTGDSAGIEVICKFCAIALILSVLVQNGNV